MNNAAWFDSCQAGVQALEFVAEFIVVDSQLVEQDGVHGPFLLDSAIPHHPHLVILRQSRYRACWNDTLSRN